MPILIKWHVSVGDLDMVGAMDEDGRILGNDDEDGISEGTKLATGDGL